MCSEKLRVIIYGTGNRAISYIKKIKNMNWLTITGVVDRDRNKVGSMFLDYLVTSPIDLKTKEYDILLIASTYQDEIEKELEEHFAVPALKIKKDKFFHNNLIKYEYQKHYHKIEFVPMNPLLSDDKLVIYTAVFGNYDVLMSPLFPEKNCDYICFTDNPELKSDIWKIIIVEPTHPDPNRSAKIYKILPHNYLRDYTWSIWIDGNYTLIGSMRELVNQSVGKSQMSFLIHTERNCVYEEAAVCIKQHKDNECIINQQINLYKEMGYPEQNGLICGSCIIRNHKNKKVQALMERWWKEIEHGSRRDQLSFNYSAWAEHIFYDLMQIHTFENPYFRVNEHKTSQEIKNGHVC